MQLYVTEETLKAQQQYADHWIPVYLKSEVDAALAEKNALIDKLQRALQGLPEAALDGGWNLLDYTNALKADIGNDTARLDKLPSVEKGWLIENGKTNEARRYRCIDDTGCVEWTADHMQALRFARRQDADRFCISDDDAWAIVEHTWTTDPVREAIDAHTGEKP